MNTSLESSSPMQSCCRLAFPSSQPALQDYKPNGAANSSSAGRLNTAESLHLDPYIDAVQVRSRINNRRGPRVKAAPSMPGRAHELPLKSPSYYSKTVLVKSTANADSTDDSDDDSDSEFGDHELVEHHHYYHSGHSHEKSYKGANKAHELSMKSKTKRRRKKKKVSYAYVLQPVHEEPHKGYAGNKYGAKRVTQRGKLSVAGLLGYALLCVNYLLVQQQPGYNKYNAQEYQEYSPHGNKLVGARLAGPVILAHCGQLPEPTALVHLPSEQVASSTRTKRAAPKRSPPAYYYTLRPAASELAVLSPIQSYLNRLLLPELSADDQYNPIQIVRRPAARTVATGERALLVTGNRRLLDASRPQVVRTHDNLASQRGRRVHIEMRVARHRMAGPQRPVSLAEDDEPFGWAPLAVRAPRLPDENDAGDQVQADQPAANNNSSTLAPGNNQIVDLPEFALAGDSVELTCSHRIPVGRLYSVKWFKDSLEFYRFIPANGPRTKSALFLPDVRLDLGRSSADAIYLRNATHRTSGLYRCEAVSEGPNFETVSGERAMQVYALPERSPHLALLERAERQTLLEPESALAAPLVRCESAPSKPAAQLRLFIDNRLVDVSRMVQNLTKSYSDGLETTLASFRIQLSDFTYANSSNLKLKSAQKPDAGRPSEQKAAASISTTTTTTTSTTTTTTPRPSQNKGKGQQQRPNAKVQFDEPQSKKQPDRKPDNNGRQRRPNQNLTSSSRRLAAAASEPLQLPEGRDNQRKSPVGGDTVAAANYVARPEAGARVVRRQASGGGGDDEQLYSDYIRIKCTSLVPAAGYELTSELNVPLTLVVPERALREPGGNLQMRRQDAAWRRQAADGGDLTPPIRIGGSLQAPRLVQIDRMAQASSAAPAKPATALPLSHDNDNNNSNQTAASPNNNARANKSSARDRALEQRAKYLDELAKRAKSATATATAAAANGAPPYLLHPIHSAHQLIVSLALSAWLAVYAARAA